MNTHTVTPIEVLLALVVAPLAGIGLVLVVGTALNVIVW